ncbi:MAG: DUF1064 domain-containing protein [Eubacteriales bacterium]|nr:DUF1064 domain-containing protein [Eubacteriales bacterium]
MSKYHSKKTVIDGITFDSRKEARRYRELSLLERAGAISDLERQVKFVLIPAQREVSKERYTRGAKKGEFKPGKLLERECSYVADFRYTENGQVIVEDTKGFRTPEYILKRKLMLYKYGIQIKEV